MADGWLIEQKPRLRHPHRHDRNHLSRATDLVHGCLDLGDPRRDTCGIGITMNDDDVDIRTNEPKTGLYSGRNVLGYLEWRKVRTAQVDRPASSQEQELHDIGKRSV
jgi:hypothetical protein